MFHGVFCDFAWLFCSIFEEFEYEGTRWTFYGKLIAVKGSLKSLTILLTMIFLILLSFLTEELSDSFR